MKLFDGNGNIILQKGKPFPAYWNATMENVVSTLRANELAIGEPMVAFVFITDVHWNFNAKRSPALIEYIRENYRDIPVIFGGDIIGSTQPTKALAIEEIKDMISAFGPILYLIGNHDTNANTDALDNDELYSVIIRNNENIYGCVTSGDTTGMYFDCPSQKTRFIMLRQELTMDLAFADVMQYMEDRITETPAGWTHVVIAHDFSTVGNATSARIASAVGATKHAIAFSGHTHRNTVTVYNDITFIATQTDSVNVPTGAIGMKLTSTNEQSFDVVQLDTRNRVAYLTRVGAGEDREINY